jgi:molybdopterin synthase catalytic subunit
MSCYNEAQANFSCNEKVKMQIHMRYFAALRELTGTNEEWLELSDGANVADLRALLLDREPRLANPLARAVCAVNHTYVTPATILHAGDEVAFIPPVGGGQETNMEPLILITHDPLDRTALVAAVAHPGVGGIVIFEGVVRDNARGKQVRYLEYEVYPEMAIAQIRAIITEAETRFGATRVAVAHRVGRLEIGEASVIIVVATPHRGEAFEACRYIIDTLKTTVPIWKKEVATNGEEWVEG